MARRRSRRRNKNKFPRSLAWLVVVFFGSLLGGWYQPSLPVIGPIVSSLLQRSSSEASTKEAGFKEEFLSAVERLKSGMGGEPPEIESSRPETLRLASYQKASDTITIATFNIQVFGTSKMSKPWVVDVLAAVCRQFDVVAIQEVRSQDDELIPTFVQAINKNGSRYAHVIGPRLGRTVSTEQYVYVYDTTRIEIDPASVGTMGDPADLLHREPLVARFRARTPDNQGGFSFWLVNVHTDPDEADEEVEVLADVFQVMGSAHSEEDDVILLGDLNVSDKQLGRLGAMPGMAWAVHDATTTTRKTKTYDNLVFQMPYTSEYTGRWGVLDLESNFGLNREQALEVSDHLPVWAEFTLREATGQTGVANEATRVRR